MSIGWFFYQKSWEGLACCLLCLTALVDYSHTASSSSVCVGCVYICVYVPARVSVRVCAHAGTVADRGSPAWVESVTAQFGSRYHQSGSKFFVSFLALAFPNHTGRSHLNLNPVEDRPMLRIMRERSSFFSRSPGSFLVASCGAGEFSPRLCIPAQPPALCWGGLSVLAPYLWFVRGLLTVPTRQRMPRPPG